MNNYIARKKFVNLIKEENQEIDYKNLYLLKHHIMESCRIIPNRISGVSAQQQRRLTESIKLARFLALLPYTDQQQQR